MVSKELLEVLACPQCKGPLTLVEEKSALECPKCRLRYAIADGIPVMLVEEAEKF